MCRLNCTTFDFLGFFSFIFPSEWEYKTDFLGPRYQNLVLGSEFSVDEQHFVVSTKFSLCNRISFWNFQIFLRLHVKFVQHFGFAEDTGIHFEIKKSGHFGIWDIAFGIPNRCTSKVNFFVLIWIFKNTDFYLKYRFFLQIS